METDKKKHKSGFALLKEKLAKAEAKNAELQKEKEILVQTAQDNYCRVEKERDELKEKLTDVINEKDSFANDCKRLYMDAESKQDTIEQQSRKISQLTAELKVAQGNLETTDREHERQLKAMYDHMGWFKRMTWDWHHAPTFKEDERWNETH